MRSISISTILLFVLIGFTPATPAHAIDTVRIISDVSDHAINTLKNTVITALGIEEVSGSIEELIQKEKILDPIQWAMSKQLQQQLTGNMLKWLGGQLEGQDGTPQFVQDYANHYLNISVDVGGDFVFGNELTGLCSEEEDFLVKEKVYQYLAQTSQDASGQIFSCPDPDSVVEESQGILASMALRISSCDTPICAQYEAKSELALRQLNAIENEADLLDKTQGMLAQKVCEEVETPTGIRSNCQIINPPSLAADAVSFNLIELPGLQLLDMDEFNESVSNLMSNLTNQAITSVTGALGLTGHPSYSSNVFGDDGTLSYVDALVADKVSDYQSIDANPIGSSLNAEKDYYSIRNSILNDINALDTENEDNHDEFPGCYDLELNYDLGMPNPDPDRPCYSNDNLAALQNDLEADLVESSNTLSILTLLNDQFNSTTESGVKLSILNSYTSYKNQNPDKLHSNLDNQAYVASCVELSIAEMLELFEYQMSVERQSCN